MKSDIYEHYTSLGDVWVDLFSIQTPDQLPHISQLWSPYLMLRQKTRTVCADISTSSTLFTNVLKYDTELDLSTLKKMCIDPMLSCLNSGEELSQYVVKIIVLHFKLNKCKKLVANMQYGDPLMELFYCLIKDIALLSKEKLSDTNDEGSDPNTESESGKPLITQCDPPPDSGPVHKKNSSQCFPHREDDLGTPKHGGLCDPNFKFTMGKTNADNLVVMGDDESEDHNHHWHQDLDHAGQKKKKKKKRTNGGMSALAARKLRIPSERVVKRSTRRKTGEVSPLTKHDRGRGQKHKPPNDGALLRSTRRKPGGRSSLTKYDRVGGLSTRGVKYNVPTKSTIPQIKTSKRELSLGHKELTLKKKQELEQEKKQKTKKKKRKTKVEETSKRGDCGSDNTKDRDGSKLKIQSHGLPVNITDTKYADYDTETDMEESADSGEEAGDIGTRGGKAPLSITA